MIIKHKDSQRAPKKNPSISKSALRLIPHCYVMFFLLFIYLFIYLCSFKSKRSTKRPVCNNIMIIIILSMTDSVFLSRYAFTALAVCLWLLSCWKIKNLPIRQMLLHTGSKSDAVIISLLLTKSPTSLAEMQFKPPPCFIDSYRQSPPELLRTQKRKTCYWFSVQFFNHYLSLRQKKYYFMPIKLYVFFLC